LSAASELLSLIELFLIRLVAALDLGVDLGAGRRDVPMTDT
jgi:hypothetical protein